MDIKGVTNENVAYYISKYMTKDEPTNVTEENGANFARRYLEVRNYSLPEVCHYSMGNQISAFSVKVVAIPLCHSLINKRTLRPVHQIANLEDDSEDIFYDNAVDKYCKRSELLESLTIIEYFSQFQKAPRNFRGDVFIDQGGESWKRCSRPLIVRVYPYYTEWAADRYYAQVILKLNSFRDPESLLQESMPWREFTTENHNAYVNIDTTFEETHHDELMHTDNYPDDLYSKIVNMYYLTLQHVRPSISDLSPSQYAAYNSIVASDRRFHLVTGGPGTGKNLSIKNLKSCFTAAG